MDPERLRRGSLTRRKWLVGLVLISGPLCSVAARAGTDAAVVEYLYIEANDRGSSGGHAAVRLGDTCYHFQHGDDGTIRLRRDSNEQFELLYRVLGNRTIHASRLELSAGTYERLRAAFEARYLTESREFEVLASLRENRDVLQQLLEGEGEALRVPGSDYFFSEQARLLSGSGEPEAASAAIEAVAERVRRSDGQGVLGRRADELRESIARLEPESDGDPIALAEPGRLPEAPVTFARRYRELLSGLLAIEVLRTAPALRSEAVVDSIDREFDLGPDDIERLRAYARQLEARLVRLFDSTRPDWGYPMLVGLARLAALDASIRSGHLVLLDTHTDGVPIVPEQTVSRHAATLALVLEERRADFRAALRAFFADEDPGEARLSWLEGAGNVLAEMGRALGQRTALRVHAGDLLPVRSVQRRDWPAPVVDARLLAVALSAARARERDWQDALVRRRGYDVVRHNCVTEILRIVDLAVGAEGLGGRFAARHGLNFIPFVSARTVEGTPAVSAVTQRPSYRRLALARMREREGALRVALRESNRATARALEFNEADSFFVFFTDETVALRPLLGSVNLAAGLGAALTGAVLLPFDRGDTLRAGLDGALFSLPELAFVNIRKGSLAFAPRMWAGAAVDRLGGAARSHPFRP